MGKNNEKREIVEENIVFSNIENKFNESAGDDSRREIEEYNSYVKNMEEAIDVLDGYDEFSSLNIAASAYEYREDETYGYGIEKAPMHRSGNNRDVILNHQKNAAHMFLENLRGFGLLADVVGSGKTFEAGVVLSELTYRGKVGTLLIVAISEVISSWEDVICNKFGLGDAFIVIKREKDDFTYKKDKRTENLGRNFKWSDYIERDGRRPLRPVLIDLEVFKYLSRDTTFSENCIFDMIIVDEAHELCNTDNIEAMGLLSEMIRRKKEDGTGNECYCLLLSATPHNGDLEGMFPLWYFICRRGGEPEEFFNGSRDAHGDVYNKEHDHYNNDICYGAANISDFVRKKKISDFEKIGGMDAGMRLHLRHYLERHGKNIGEEFDNANEWTKERVIDEFLGITQSRDKNFGVNSEEAKVEEKKKREYREKEEKSIADAYRNLLNLIMIRQTKNQVSNVSQRGKKAVNLYFYPVKKGSLESGVIDGIRTGGDIKLDYTKVFKNFPETYYPDILSGNTRTGLFDNLGGLSPQEYYSMIVGALFDRFNESAYRISESDGFKAGCKNYYTAMMENFDDMGDVLTYREPAMSVDGQYNLFMPYEGDSEQDSYDNKFAYLLKILKKHSSDRVIVFFDYGRETNNKVTHVDGSVTESLYDRFEKQLRSKFRSRNVIAIEAAGADTDEKIELYNSDSSDGCILIVKGGFTHGANLQKASVIVNFQVSCDPVDMEQKIGRIFRLGQKNHVTVYSMADVNDLEGYALAYFTGIGLFALDNGDATILSGCNDSEMVTVRCSECNNVAIMTKTEYDTYRSELNIGTETRPEYISRMNKNERKMYVTTLNKAGLLSDDEKEIPYNEEYLGRGKEIICRDPTHSNKGFILMTPINNGEFVCSDDSSHKFMRGKRSDDEGYKCMDSFGQIMCSSGGRGNRSYFCNKLCALSHCDAHARAFPDCGAVKAFNAGDAYSACIEKCLDAGNGKRCPYFEKCRTGLKSYRCMPESDTANMERSIMECIECVEYDKAIKFEFRCTPKPHILQFNDDWSGAECPICKAKNPKKTPGELRKVPMRTFSEHIGYLWDIDRAGSPYFCNILTDEAKRVGEIEQILKKSSQGE